VAVACSCVVDRVVVDMTRFCNLYHGLVLVHHLTALLYEQVFELLVLFDQFQYKSHLHVF